MDFYCPIGCNCTDITVCVECDFYGFIELLLEEHYNNIEELEKGAKEE